MSWNNYQWTAYRDFSRLACIHNIWIICYLKKKIYQSQKTDKLLSRMSTRKMKSHYEKRRNHPKCQKRSASGTFFKIFTLGGVRLYFPHYSHFQIFNVNKGLKRFFIYMLLMCDTGVSHMSSFQSIAGQNINII